MMTDKAPSQQLMLYMLIFPDPNLSAFSVFVSCNITHITTSWQYNTSYLSPRSHLQNPINDMFFIVIYCEIQLVFYGTKDTVSSVLRLL